MDLPAEWPDQADLKCALGPPLRVWHPHIAASSHNCHQVAAATRLTPCWAMGPSC